ncbi:hypothetical protein [Colwellia sp. E150_009]
MSKLLASFVCYCLIYIVPFSVKASTVWQVPVSDFITTNKIDLTKPPQCINVPSDSHFGATVTISWCAVEGAIKYQLVGLAESTVDITHDNLSYSTNHLQQGLHQLWLRVCFKSGCSIYSDTFTIKISPPEPPSKLIGIIKPTTIFEKANYLLTWGATSNATHYEIEHNNDSGTETIIVVATNYEMSNATSSDSYRIRACIEQVCGEYSEPISYQVKSAIEQGLEITNLVPWEGGYASIDGVFDLQWQQQVNIDRYDIIYGYSDLDTEEWLEHSINNLPGNAFSQRIVLPKDVRNGLVSFYLIPYRQNNAVNSLKVNGLIKRQLARPSISHFSNMTGKCDTTGNCDHYFKVKFKKIDQASRYQIFVSYSALKNGNEQRYRGVLYYDADQSSPNYPLPTEENGEFVTEFNLNSLADKNGVTPIAGAVHVEGQAMRPDSYPSAVQLQIMSNLTETKTLAWREGSNQLVLDVITPLPSTVFSLDDIIIANVFACDKGVSGTCNSNENGLGIDFIEYTLQGPKIDFSYKIMDSSFNYFQSFEPLFESNSTAKTGNYNLFINVVNTSGNNITKLITFTREVGSYNTPVISNITAAENNSEYLIEWTGYQHADVKRLYKKINENLVSIVDYNIEPEKFSVTPSSNNEELYYIETCFGTDCHSVQANHCTSSAACEVRRSEFFLLVPTVQPKGFSIRTELLGTPIK